MNRLSLLLLLLLALSRAEAANVAQLTNAPSITRTTLLYGAEYRGGTNYTNYAISGERISQGMLGTNLIPVAPGESLSYYATNAPAWSVLQLGAGVYDVGSNHIRLPHGVSLVGAGQDVTFISGNGSFQTNGCIVNPGSTSLVANLTIIASNRNLYYQAPLGCSFYLGKAFTNATIRNVRLVGGTDCFFVYTNVPCSWKVYDSTAQSGWDAVALQADVPTAHDLRFFNCSLTSDLSTTTQPNAVSTAKANCIATLAGRIELFGCSLTATNATDVRCIVIAGSSATVTETGCIMKAAGTSTAYLADNSGGGTMNICASDARIEETFSAMNWCGNNIFLTNILYSNGGGLSIRDDDMLNNPIRISESAGLNVGSLTDPGTSCIAIGVAGGGFKVKEGSNATMGTGKLTSGAATVSTTAVATNSRILVVAVCTANAAQGLSISNIVAGTSFRVHSASGADANRFDWLIMNPAP